MQATPLTAAEVIAALFEADGSMRDITFTPVLPPKLAPLIERLKADFTLVHASDRDDHDVRDAILSDSLALASTPELSLHSYWESGTHPISALQLFAFWPEPDGRAFVELSFHPADLVRERFDLSSFMAGINAWSEALEAGNFFVRHENMSWDAAQGITAGVIFTKQWRPLL